MFYFYMLFIAIIFLIIFFLGNVVESNINLNFNYSKLYYKNDIEVSLTNAIDYLNFKESLVPHLNYNDKKEIVFYNNEINKTEYILYYLHGFNSTKVIGKNITLQISNIYKSNIYFARLEGDGVYNRENYCTNFYTNLRIIYEDLLICQLLGNNIILIGESTGCTYNIIASIIFKKLNIQDNIMFSPNIEPIGINSIVTKFLSYGFGKYIISLANNKIVINNVLVSSKVLEPLIGALAALRKIKYQYNKNCIIFTSEFDPQVSNEAIKDFYNKINVSKKNLYIIKNFKDHTTLSYNNYDIILKMILKYHESNNQNIIQAIG